MTERVEVVAGAVVRRGRILLTQRLPGKDLAYLWESPGGKVEPGESAAQALARELCEELGVVVAVVEGATPVAGPYEFDPPLVGVACRLTFYRAEIADQEPFSRASIGLGWFTAEEMLGLDLAPGNARAVGKLLDLVRRLAAGDVGDLDVKARKLKKALDLLARRGPIDPADKT